MSSSGGDRKKRQELEEQARAYLSPDEIKMTPSRKLEQMKELRSGRHVDTDGNERSRDYDTVDPSYDDQEDSRSYGQTPVNKPLSSGNTPSTTSSAFWKSLSPLDS